MTEYVLMEIDASASVTTFDGDVSSVKRGHFGAFDYMPDGEGTIYVAGGDARLAIDDAEGLGAEVLAPGRFVLCGVSYGSISYHFPTGRSSFTEHGVNYRCLAALAVAVSREDAEAYVDVLKPSGRNTITDTTLTAEIAAAPSRTKPGGNRGGSVGKPRHPLTPDDAKMKQVYFNMTEAEKRCLLDLMPSNTRVRTLAVIELLRRHQDELNGIAAELAAGD